jgi:hypothetical protein
MNLLIQYFFSFLAEAFDQVPGLKKIKGYRAAIGIALLAVVYFLNAAKISPEGFKDIMEPILLTFTGLALNAKRNDLVNP